MSITDVPGPDAAEDRSLVHQFIRAHGRRPTPDELDELRGDAPTARSVRQVRARHAAPAPSLTAALRREVARLVSRL